MTESMEFEAEYVNEALQRLNINDRQHILEHNVSNGEDALEEMMGEAEALQSQTLWTAVHKYEEEWQQLCRDARDTDDLGELRRRALLGSLRASRFRSVSWRLLLRLLPPDPEAWPIVLHDQREHYARLYAELHVSPRVSADDNPLSQDTKSEWHQYFCNQELQAVIRQDVVRTFPGIDYFRGSDVQDKMVSILFCYARANPDMCYRQGMHEILAPLLFVLHSDHQVLMHSREQAPVSWEIIKVLDPQHLEADAYTLFCRIMAGIESCYRIHDVSPSNTGHFPYYSTSQERRDSKQETELTVQLTLIRDEILAHTDPQLTKHLQKLDIPLTLFGIRWLRLLFGREFPLQDLLVLWDAIFAEAEGGSSFELVNYIVVAMLITIRNQLISGDYTTCLTFLMRYPGAVDISYIIDYALYLKYPEKYCQPTSMNLINMPVINIDSRNGMNRGPMEIEKNLFQNTKATNLTTEQNEIKDKKGKNNKKKEDGPLSKRLSKLSAKRWGKQQQTVAILPNGEDNAIVEGYTLDDPAYLGAELQRAVQLIKNSQTELSHHISTIEFASIDTEPSVKRALEGMKQVCQQLGSFRSLPAEVEPATEAGEVKSTPIKPTSLPSSPVMSAPALSNFKLTVFCTSEGSDDKVLGAPSADPFNFYS